MGRDSSTQGELGNRSDLGCLELSRLGLEAILSYLDLGDEWGAKSEERRAGDVEAEKVHRLYLEREGATSGNW